MQLQQTVKSFIRPGDQSGYVAECLEISVVTQGRKLFKSDRNKGSSNYQLLLEKITKL
jgi:hypothetical protein